MAKTTVIKRSSDSALKNIDDKQYSDRAYEYVMKLHADKGIPYTEIATLMNKEGWCGPSGSKLTQPILSKFMTSRGYKMFERGGKHKTETTKIPVLNPNNPTWENDVIRILQNDFPEETKKRLIIALASAPETKRSENNNKE